MSDEALFLGTGASLGVPIVGCSCDTCLSSNPRNKRFRSSILLTVKGKKILVDAGPDLRMQALTHHIYHLDGVIFTHSHHDHTAGIDDLRIYHFKNKGPLPSLVSRETAEDLRKRFYFMLEKQPKEPVNTERLRLQILENQEGEIDFLGIPITYFTYKQIGMGVLGIRIGAFAYITDIKEYDPSIFDHLEGVKTLVISALRFTSSHMHFTVDEAIDFIEKVGSEHNFLTHLSHDLEHEKTNAYLPASIKLAYDGLQISMQYGV